MAQAKKTSKETKEIKEEDKETTEVSAIGLSKEEEKRAIQSTINQLNKKFGSDVFASKEEIMFHDAISTGSAKIDDLIGNKGLITGRVHEVYSEPSGGKTTLATILCRNALEKFKDKRVVYIDSEQAFNMQYAKELGLPVADDRFMFTQPASAEEALEIAYSLISTGGVSLVVFDSVPALISKRDMEREFNEEGMAEIARILSSKIPRFIKLLNQTNATILFINQTRQNVGSFYGGTTTPGGNALKFYATTRIELRRTKVLTDKDEPYGQEIKVTIKKNKAAQPFGVTETNIYFGKGFNFIEEAVDLGIQERIITRAGAWYTAPGSEETFQGKEALYTFYRENDDMFKVLQDKVFH